MISLDPSSLEFYNCQKYYIKFLCHLDLEYLLSSFQDPGFKNSEISPCRAKKSRFVAPGICYSILAPNAFCLSGHHNTAPSEGVYKRSHLYRQQGLTGLRKSTVQRSLTFKFNFCLLITDFQMTEKEI